MSVNNVNLLRDQSLQSLLQDQIAGNTSGPIRLYFADKENVSNVATNRHSIMRINETDIKLAKKERIAIAQKDASKKVKRVVSDIKNKSTVVKEGFGKYFRDPIYRRELHGNLNKFAKIHKKSIITVAAVLTTGLMYSKLNSGKSSNMRIAPRNTFMTNRNSYMPTSYNRGFDEIKKLTTDFGSNVHLDKTTSKIMVSPVNSTRHGFKTSTGSIMRGNIALANYSNAINHTRY